MGEFMKGIFTRLGKTIEYWMSERGAPDFLITTIISAVFFFISTGIHEMGHVLVAKFLNCEAGIQYVHMWTGGSGIGECASSSLVLIALAGPLTTFIIGLLLWFSEPDGRERMLALIMFFLSTVMQLYPQYPLDMGKAIQWGLNPSVGWLIYWIIFAICFNLIWLEIKD